MKQAIDGKEVFTKVIPDKIFSKIIDDFFNISVQNEYNDSKLWNHMKTPCEILHTLAN